MSPSHDGRVPRILRPSDDEVVCPRCLARFPWSRAPLSVAARMEDEASSATNVIDAPKFRRLIDPAEVMAVFPEPTAASAWLLGNGAMRVCPRSIPEGWGAAPYELSANFYTSIDSREPFHEMPYDYGDAERFVVAVVGSPQSGKSTYLATLFWSLVNGDLSAVGFESRYWEHPPMREYERTEARQVNVDRRVLSGTDDLRGRTITLTLERDDARLAGPAPQWAAVDRMFGRLPEPGRRSLVHLVLFDIAGETLLEVERTADNFPLLAADAFLFLVEPDHIPEVSRRRGMQPVAGAGTGNRDIDRLIEYLRRVTEYDDGALARRPVAVAVSKADVLDPLAPSALRTEWMADLPRALCIPRPGDRRHGSEEALRLAASLPFTGDHQAFEDVLENRSRTVYSFIHAHGASRLADQFMRIFDTTSFHFVSATGCKAIDERFDTIAPRGTLAPILTLLYQARVAG